MSRSLRQFTCLCLLFAMPLALLVSSIAFADEDRPGLLAQLIYPSHTGEQRAELEACVGAIGFVETVTIEPTEGTVRVTTKITNKSKFPITGIVVTVIDPDVLAVGLDGRSILRFDKLEPGDVIYYVEEVPSIAEYFDDAATTSIVAVDVLDNSGLGIIKKIFETRWPQISSIEDLNAARKQFCLQTQ